MELSRVRKTRIVAIFIILLTTVTAAWVYLRGTGGGNGDVARLSTVPPYGGSFALIDHNAKPVTDADFRGKFMLVYFGYTYCPDVCPMGLTVISQALDLLGEAADQVAPIFISVDSERDTTEVMKDYVENFHPRLIGLSGSLDQVAAAARKYRVYYAKQKAEADDPDGYFMDHSNLTYLMGPDGKHLTNFTGGETAQGMAKKINEIIDAVK